MALGLQRARLMRLLAVLSFLSLSQAAASAQDASPIVVTIDPGSARVSEVAVMREIAEATGRVIVAPSDPGAREAGERLSITREMPGRWSVRYVAPEANATRVVLARNVREVPHMLARACRDLLFPPAEAPIEVDLVDPFGGIWSWDPVAEAIRAELLEPFARPTHALYVSVVDPFAPAGLWVDLDDPWASR
jgi:hypothetical protein